MTAPRLLFLWPMLARNVEPLSPAVRSAKAAIRVRSLHRTRPRARPDTLHQRYGTANEPPPRLEGVQLPSSASVTPSSADAPKALPKIGEELQRDGEEEVKAEHVESPRQAEQRTEPTTVDGKDLSTVTMDPALDAAESQATARPLGAPSQPDDHPMESLLNTVPDPGQMAEEQKASTKSTPEEEQSNITVDEHAPSIKAPHINPPRYVHHFDTYGLVRRLVDSGWKEDNAIMSMKAVRLMLADNMDLARDALVSKSQVENETYLFRAACAELRTEVMARRKSEQEKMRTERTQLQHEVDILSQRLGQESAVLKDDLKGMFDDRKMAVRNEQRGMESKVQRLNYQITVELQADGKSDVEGLRWVMTRRVIIALGTVILMVVGSLKLYSNALHEQELDAKRRANMRSSSTQTSGSDGETTDAGGREYRLVGGREMLVQEGDNPAFVSLG